MKKKGDRRRKRGWGMEMEGEEKKGREDRGNG